MRYLYLLFLGICSAKAQTDTLVLQTPHNHAIEQMFFSNDGKLLYTVSQGDNQIKIWDVRVGKLIKNVEINSSYKEFHLYKSENDALHLEYTEEDKDAIAFINSRGTIINRTPYPDSALVFHDKFSGKLIFEDFYNKNFEIWDIRSGKINLTDSFPDNYFHYEKGFIFRTVGQSEIVVYDLLSESYLDTIKVDNVDFRFSLKCSIAPNKQWFYFIKGESIYSKNLRTKAETECYKGKKFISSFRLDPTGKYLFIEEEGNTLCLINKANKDSEPVFEYHMVIESSTCEKINFISNSTVEVEKGAYPRVSYLVYDLDKRQKLDVTTYEMTFKDRRSYSSYALSSNSQYIAQSWYCNPQNKSFSFYRNEYTNTIRFYSINDPNVPFVNINLGELADISSFTFTPDSKKILISGTFRNSLKSFLNLYDLTGLLVWSAPNSQNLDDLYDVIYSMKNAYGSLYLTQSRNLGYQLWDFSQGIIKSGNIEAEVADISADTLVYAQVLDSICTLSLKNIETNNIIDTFQIKSASGFIYPEFPVKILLNRTKNEILFLTSFYLYRINCENHYVAKTALPIIIDSNADMVLISNDTIVINSITDEAVAYELSKFGEINAINCEICSLNTSNDREIYCEIVDKTEEFDDPKVKVKLFRTSNNRLIQEFNLPLKNAIISDDVFTGLQVRFNSNGNFMLIKGRNALFVYKRDINLKYSLFFEDEPAFYDIGDAVFSSISPKLFYITSEKRIIELNLTDGVSHELNLPLANQIKALYPSPDGKFLILVGDGNIITVYDLNTNKLLSNFIFSQSSACETILPNGYYRLSGKASNKIGFVKWPNFIPFDQLDIKYNRPDKILETLGEAFGNSDTSLIRSYHRAWQKRVKKLGVDTTSFREGFSFPESDIKNRDEIAYEQNQSKLQLRIVGKDAEYALDRFNVWVNEVPVFGQRGINIRAKGKNSVDTVVTVQLSDGENKIETSVLTASGIESYRVPLFVKYTPAASEPEKLYFVGIGVDRYSQDGHDLNYSVKDISDLSRNLKKKHGNNLIVDTLFDQQVTQENIRLLKKKLLQSGVNDKVIVSFSGHGLLDKNFDYYLATHSIDFDNPANGGLPYEDLEWLLDSIPARKKLLLLDACHSGEVDKEELTAINTQKTDNTIKGAKLVYQYKPIIGMKNSFELMQELFANVNRGTGATVISASGGTQYARESGTLKNGVFTYSILELMQQKQSITVSELKETVGERVVELTNGLQKPTSRTENIEFDWRVW